jgi:hypothetical protein
MDKFTLLMATVPRPTAGSSSAGRVASWRVLTLQGNLAFEREENVSARQLYEEALAEAENLFDAAALLGDAEAARFAPFVYGTSCNNVVALARRQRDPETAGIFLYRAVARFVGVAESTRAPLQLRARCLLHLDVAANALYRYFEEHGMWDAAAAFSERANAALFAVETASDTRNELELSENPHGTSEGENRAQRLVEESGVSPRRSAARGAGSRTLHRACAGSLLPAGCTSP